MARPTTNTVTYFSHDADASQRRTLTILFNNFQHEGVSAWWNLLELFSRTENHVIRIDNLENLEYTAAKLHFSADRLKEILHKMAELDAIDRDLYSEGVIWSQNFVDRLAPVYAERKRPLPLKPQLSGALTALLIPVTPLFPRIMLQSKDSIVKKSKVKESTPAPNKKPYGEFNNVFLTTQEYEKLQARFDGQTQEKIEELSEALKSKAGYDRKYTDHYATILSWARRKEKFSGEKKVFTSEPIKGLKIVK